MNNPIAIEIHREIYDNIDFTLITDPNARLLRANILLPFVVKDLVDGTMPSETPHLLEHVVCCGGEGVSSGEYKENLEADGGYTNAFTQLSIDGQLKFETTQPDHAPELVREMAHAVFFPSIDAVDVDEQREIVRAELLGYLQNPERQRYRRMTKARGIQYGDDLEALTGLDYITQGMLHNFHKEFFSRSNARVVLTGEAGELKKLVDETVGILAGIPEGMKFYAPNGESRYYEDYHDDNCPEIKDGITQYSHLAVSHEVRDNELTASEIQVVASALNIALTSGRNGLHELSRNRGLSYGVSVGVVMNHREVSVSLTDTVPVMHVNPQLKLLSEVLERVTEYSKEDFERFRRKLLGAKKITPFILTEFAKGVESRVTTEDNPELVTPIAFEDALENLRADKVVELVRTATTNLLNPTFTSRYSFGTNPLK